MPLPFVIVLFLVLVSSYFFLLLVVLPDIFSFCPHGGRDLRIDFNFFHCTVSCLDVLRLSLFLVLPYPSLTLALSTPGQFFSDNCAKSTVLPDGPFSRDILVRKSEPLFILLDVPHHLIGTYHSGVPGPTFHPTYPILPLHSMSLRTNETNGINKVIDDRQVSCVPVPCY